MYNNNNALACRGFFDMDPMREWTKRFLGMGENTILDPKYMRVDVKDIGEKYQIEAEMPGFAKEDIHVCLDDSILTIEAEKEEEEEKGDGKYLRKERRSQSFRRSFAMEDGVTADDIACKYENGILTVTVNKKDEPVQEDKAVKIEVK